MKVGIWGYAWKVSLDGLSSYCFLLWPGEVDLGGQPAISTTCGLGLVVDGLMTESHCSVEQVMSPLGEAEQVEWESQL